MNTIEMQQIISQITYKPCWRIIFNVGNHATAYRPSIQIAVDTSSDLTMDPTGKSDIRTPWKSGKRFLSQHMCRQELVGAVFGLIKDAEMHEVHEWFRYRGASIYNPHLDPDKLWLLARQANSFNVRNDAMGMSGEGV